MIISEVLGKKSKWHPKKRFFAVILLSFQFLLFAQPSSISNSEISNDEQAAVSVVRYVQLDEINLANDLRIFREEGLSSHYGRKFQNRKTANGERYLKDRYTAAHKTLPFGTIVKVTNQKNGVSTLVRINDRGPWIKKRIIDLSERSVNEIDALGLANVKSEYLMPGMVAIPDDQRYYFGYSSNIAPVILPENSLTIIDSTNLFSNAVELFNSKLHLDSEHSRFFILVGANEVCGKETINSEFKYFIGFFDGKVFKRKSGIVAEKVIIKKD